MLKLSTSIFESKGLIPSRYTCDGENMNPPLSISGVPADTQSLVLIMDDPDIPEFAKQKFGIEVFDHWVVFNIPPDTKEIFENTLPPGIEGAHSGGALGYAGPCPPDREHRYFFKLYALNTMLSLESGTSREEVERAMEGHVLESTELMARYERIKQ